MASLSDTLKANNQLFSTSSEGQKTLSGLGAGNDSPLAAAVSGVNKDSAKMAGSSANLQTATKVKTAPTLADTNRTQKDVGYQGETKASREAAALSPLTNVPDSLKNSVGQVLAGASAPVATKEVDDGTLNASLTFGADPAIAKDLAAKALNGSATQAELAQLAPMLGLSSSASAAELSNKLAQLEKGGTLGSQIASSLPDQVTLSNLSPEQLTAAGLNLTELSHSLGMTEGELQSMSLGDIRKRVSAIGAQDFSEVQRLQAVAGDVNRSSSERNEAVKRLRELGSSGVRATEEDVQRLTTTLSEDPTVTLGDEQIPLSEVFSDSTLSAAVKSYLDDPEYAAELKSSQPEFAAFIDANSAALKDATAKMDASTKQLADTQIANAKLKTPSDGITLSDSFMQLVMPGYNSFQSGSVTPPAIYSILSDNSGKYSAEYKTGLAGTLSNLSGTQPDLVKELSALTPEQLNAYGLGTAAGLAEYSKYASDAHAIANAGNDDALIEQLFGSADDMQKLVTEAHTIEQSGFAGQAGIDSQLLGVLDANHDGQVDSPAEVRARLAQLYPSASPSSLIKGESLPSIERMTTDLQAKTEANKYGLLSRVQPYLADGKVDAKEINELTSQAGSISDLTSIRAALSQSKANLLQPGALDTLNRAIDNKVNQEVTSNLGSRGINVEALTALQAVPLPLDAKTYETLKRIGQTSTTGKQDAAIAANKQQITQVSKARDQVKDLISSATDELTRTKYKGILYQLENKLKFMGGK